MVTPAGSAATTQLTISTVTTGMYGAAPIPIVAGPSSRLWPLGLALAGVLFLLFTLLKQTSARRGGIGSTATWIRMAVAAGLLVAAAGCGGSKNNSTMGTPAGTTTVMVNATSGTMMQSTSIALTVK
jgi:hypothetical protein